MKFARGRSLTDAEVGDLIMEHLDALETALEEHATALVDAAKAEAAYRVAHARLVLTNAESSDARRTAYAAYHTSDLLELRLIAGALATHAGETCRVRRAELDGLRSIVASARAATYAHD